MTDWTLPDTKNDFSNKLWLIIKENLDQLTNLRDTVAKFREPTESEIQHYLTEEADADVKKKLDKLTSLKSQVAKLETELNDVATAGLGMDYSQDDVDKSKAAFREVVSNVDAFLTTLGNTSNENAIASFAMEVKENLPSLPGAVSTTSYRSNPDASKVRKWAQESNWTDEKGKTVSDRGRIQPAAYEAYYKAHKPNAA